MFFPVFSESTYSRLAVSFSIVITLYIFGFWYLHTTQINISQKMKIITNVELLRIEKPRQTAQLMPEQPKTPAPSPVVKALQALTRPEPKPQAQVIQEANVEPVKKLVSRVALRQPELLEEKAQPVHKLPAIRIDEIKRERDAKLNDLMDMTRNKGNRAQKLITQEQGLSERSMPLPRPSVNMGQPAALEEIGTRRAAPPKITDISQPSAAQRKTTVMEAPADTSPLIEKKRALKMQLAALGTQPVLPDAAAQKVAHRENITDISGSLKERQKAKEIVELQKIIDSQEPPASKPGDVSRKSLSALSAVKAPEKITEKPLDSVRELPAEKRAPAPEMAIRKPRSVETKDMVQEVRKQALEISGPLKQRKIISTSAPAYPEWAKRKGVEAEVVLKFYVNPQGRVMPEIAVVRTSGYRELDVLGIEALKKWIFAPLANNEPQQDQWGAVTIRYILE